MSEPSSETVEEIAARLGDASDEELSSLAGDDRKGVQEAVAAEQARRSGQEGGQGAAAEDFAAEHGKPYNETTRKLAEATVKPIDPTNEAYLSQLTADSHQEEAEAKAAIVEESKGSEDTPSGSALIETASIDHDEERGEAYQRAKSAKRWGYDS